uniref:BHLH domain-containing protein n=1 Tax=Caenorhabditis tropicalis TaxID=1561998 RepID=A0A1I7UQN8_9PELO
MLPCSSNSTGPNGLEQQQSPLVHPTNVETVPVTETLEHPKNNVKVLKRARKPIRHDDFVYDASDFPKETDEDESRDRSPKKIKANSGCRCEYIVPELEHKIDVIMEGIHFIETLAKSLLAKEQTSVAEQNTELKKAQNEIQQLRRQLIIQRNQKSLRPAEN